MLDIRGWIRRQRYGGITGLNQMDAQVKMILIALVPLVSMLVVMQLLLPEEFRGLASIISLIGEAGAIGFVYMRAKTDGAGLIPLPQSHWRFPDGDVVALDLKIRPGGITKICDFQDGGKGYHLQFTERYEHQDKKLPYPYVFQTAYLKTPTNFDEAIPRHAPGEFFHGNVFINHPACDYITIYVKDWAETEEGWVPNCVLGDCGHAYQQFLGGGKPKSSVGTELWYLSYKRAQKIVESQLQHNDILEARLEIAENDNPKDFKEAAERRMKAFRKRHGRVLDTSEPLLSRIFNFQNIAKALIILGAALLISHFVLGWP
jgi:hypothetical protein